MGCSTFRPIFQRKPAQGTRFKGKTLKGSAGIRGSKLDKNFADVETLWIANKVPYWCRSGIITTSLWYDSFVDGDNIVYELLWLLKSVLRMDIILKFQHFSRSSETYLQIFTIQFETPIFSSLCAVFWEEYECGWV